MSNELQSMGFAPQSNNKMDHGALAQANESRAIAEVQAQYVIAKKFPRDEHTAMTKIMKSCERPLLAKQAIYVYPRSGSNVTGPSIRLAEALAQAWGNVDCGVREISQANGVSTAEAYAIDLETNVRISKIFHVPHVRDTKGGGTRLTSTRDIYEIVANQGARRLRACILGVIPGDVVDAALTKCDQTQHKAEEASKEPLEDRVKKMVEAFNEFGVSSDHIEKKLGHKLDTIVPAELVSLVNVYRTIKDGMADRSSFFDIASQATDSARSQLTDVVNKVKKEQKNEPDSSGEVQGGESNL